MLVPKSFIPTNFLYENDIGFTATTLGKTPVLFPFNPAPNVGPSGIVEGKRKNMSFGNVSDTIEFDRDSLQSFFYKIENIQNQLDALLK